MWEVAGRVQNDGFSSVPLVLLWSPMSRSLPPLNALRAFEAAARHLSFTDAAAELSVTQAAVSHHVKALEERLGIKLFRRVGRRLLLTDAAQRYPPEVRAAFDPLGAGA